MVVRPSENVTEVRVGIYPNATSPKEVTEEGIVTVTREVLRNA
jgi:hypothetical protein